MDLLNFYALEDVETKLLSNFFTGYDDKAACEFMVDSLKSIVDSVDDEQKKFIISKVRHSNIVKVGSIDVLDHNLNSDFACLVFLKDFMKGDVLENEI